MVFPTVTTLLAGGRGGYQWSGAHKVRATGLFAAIFVSSFWGWHRIVGYNKTVKMEQEYAKNQKMLRNIIIRQ